MMIKSRKKKNISLRVYLREEIIIFVISVIMRWNH